MSHVKVEFLGRGFDLACGEGEEDHLQQLAKEVGERLNEFEQRFTDARPTDSMLWIMTSLTLMDEIYELRRESAYWQREAINSSPPPEDAKRKETERALALSLQDIAARLESLSVEA